MTSKIFLRIAALMILVHLLGHAVGHFTWDKPEDQQMQGVVDTMLGYRANFMGATRSMGDYFNGYSLMMFFIYGMTISLLWSVSQFAESERSVTSRILYPIGIAYVAFGVIEFYYFFPFAAIMSLGAGILILLAVFRKA